MESGYPGTTYAPGSVDRLTQVLLRAHARHPLARDHADPVQGWTDRAKEVGEAPLRDKWRNPACGTPAVRVLSVRSQRAPACSATMTSTTARLQRHRSRPIMRRVPRSSRRTHRSTMPRSCSMTARSFGGSRSSSSPGLTLLRGTNGAGKTTLLRAFAGLAPLARGRRSVPGRAAAVHRPPSDAAARTHRAGEPHVPRRVPRPRRERRRARRCGSGGSATRWIGRSSGSPRDSDAAHRSRGSRPSRSPSSFSTSRSPTSTRTRSFVFAPR